MVITDGVALALWVGLVLCGALALLAAAAIGTKPFDDQGDGQSRQPRGHELPPHDSLDQWT